MTKQCNFLIYIPRMHLESSDPAAHISILRDELIPHNFILVALAGSKELSAVDQIHSQLLAIYNWNGLLELGCLNMFSHKGLFGSLWLALCLPVLVNALILNRGVNDPFYQPEDGWKNKEPGDILRWREIHPKFIGGNFNVASAYQLLYRTSQNTPDQPDHTVTTILVPHNAKKNSLVVGSVAQDANGKQCTPSAGYTYNSQTNVVFMLDETFFLQYLQEGYTMTIPDKEGPKNAFAAGRMEGYMTLDAIRATLAFSKLGLSKNTKVAGYGYSGGSITLGWASALKPAYAPELNVIGWAYGGTPSNLSGTVEKLDDTIFAGLVAAGIAGVSDVYPEVQSYLKKVLTPTGKKALQFCREHCLADIILKFPFESFKTTKYQNRGPDVFKNAAVQKMFTELTMGLKSHETPDAPVYMYHGQQDEIIPYGDAMKTAKAWCRNGAQIQFMSYSHPEMGHFVTEITGSVPAFHFIRDRFNNKELPSGCHFKTSDTLVFKPETLGGNAEEIIDAILSVFGHHIGPEANVLAAKKTIIKRGNDNTVTEYQASEQNIALERHMAKRSKTLVINSN